MLLVIPPIGSAYATFKGDVVSYEIKVTFEDGTQASASGNTVVGDGIEVDPLSPKLSWLSLDIKSDSFEFVYNGTTNRALQRVEFTLSDLDWSGKPDQVILAEVEKLLPLGGYALVTTTEDSVTMTIEHYIYDTFVWWWWSTVAVEVFTIDNPPKYAEFDVGDADEMKCVNINSKGLVPIIIYGNENVDVTEIDWGSVRVAGLYVRSRRHAGLFCAEDYANDDNHLDLKCKMVDFVQRWAVNDGVVRMMARTQDGSRVIGFDEVCTIQK